MELGRIPDKVVDREILVMTESRHQIPSHSHLSSRSEQLQESILELTFVDVTKSQRKVSSIAE
jgi:hypothetical protein